MITLILLATGLLTAPSHATPALERRLQKPACSGSLANESRDHSPQLRTWLSERARPQFPGGLEIDTLILRRVMLVPDPDRARELDHAFLAVARGRGIEVPVALAQILVREVNAPAPEIILLGDRLTWDPVTGDAASGEFMLLVAAEQRAALTAFGATTYALHLAPAGRYVAVIIASREGPADRYVATLKLLRDVREWITPATPQLRLVRD